MNEPSFDQADNKSVGSRRETLAPTDNINVTTASEDSRHVMQESSEDTNKTLAIGGIVHEMITLHKESTDGSGRETPASSKENLDSTGRETPVSSKEDIDSTGLGRETPVNYNKDIESTGRETPVTSNEENDGQRRETLQSSDSIKAQKEIVNVFAVHAGSSSVKLIVAGESIIARIDLGAEITILSKKVYDRLKRKPAKVNEVAMQMADPSAGFTGFIIKPIEIKLGRKTYKERIYAAGT